MELDQVKAVLEKLLQNLELDSTEELDTLKNKLLDASESGPEGIEQLLEKEASQLRLEAQKLAEKLLSQIKGRS